MSTIRNSYQEGSVVRERRAKGPDVWVLRYRGTRPDGQTCQRKEVIGPVTRFRTKSEARNAIRSRVAEINTARQATATMTVEEAWDHFQRHELHDTEIARSASTIENYITIFSTHILPRWGQTALEKVEAVEVERWLRTLQTRPASAPSGVFALPPRPLAPASKAKIKSRMYSLFQHAIRHKLYVGSNPMDTVRQGSKRQIKPEILSLGEIKLIMENIGTPAIQMAVLVAGATGLRRSEVGGLKWQDIDFQNHWIRPTQGVLRKHVTSLKTRASGEPIPIHPALSAALVGWRNQSLYRADGDWVFASPATSGVRPYWLDSALKRHIRPAALQAGINKKIGWHTFRRSFATLLTTQKESVKVVQELMRHADPKVTLKLYAQGEEMPKRAAHLHFEDLFNANLKAPLTIDASAAAG